MENAEESTGLDSPPQGFPLPNNVRDSSEFEHGLASELPESVVVEGYETDMSMSSVIEFYRYNVTEWKKIDEDTTYKYVLDSKCEYHILLYSKGDSKIEVVVVSKGDLSKYSSGTLFGIIYSPR